MLDNMEGQDLLNAARNLKERWGGKRKFLLESSGGITEENLQERAINGAYGFESSRRKTNFTLVTEIDIFSTSAVHQSVPHIDYSLKIQQKPIS